jgi:hypothetical protein
VTGMDRELIATLFQTGGRLVTSLLQTYGLRRQPPKIEMPKSEAKEKRVTTEETIAYQRRELAKELTLLEGHLSQGCKINNKACDCCEKHPIKIEGLALETAGMTPDPVYKRLASWVQEISPIITEEAAASGSYEGQYPQLAIQARDFRKTIMGSDLWKEVNNEAEQ